MLRTAFAFCLFALPAVAAVEIGDDGLHKPDWLEETFLDLREDLADAESQGKRLMIIVEQRGCIYCTRMHEEIFPIAAIDAYLREKFFVVQINMFGDLEVTDFNGETLPEKDMVAAWGLLFTPTMVFLPHEVAEDASAVDAAVAVMPGAFGEHTTLNLLHWVGEEIYLTDEGFQRYHARRIAEQGIVE